MASLTRHREQNLEWSEPYALSHICAPCVRAEHGARITEHEFRMAQKVRIIGVPMDLGQSRRGVDMGPSALRLAGLNAKLGSLGYAVEDLGNVSVSQQESVPTGPENAKYLPQIAKTCTTLAQMVNRAMVAGHLPLVLGGDHSIAAGTVAGVASEKAASTA